MNQIELIAALPAWKWKPHSAKEIALTGEQLVMQSDFVWQVGNVAVAGFIYHSYTSPPWMWFVLNEGITVADMIDFRRLAEQIPKGTLTGVDLDFPLTMRFAKIYGFVEVDQTIERAGHIYRVMRKD
jgi:hypothetical protein